MVVPGKRISLGRSITTSVLLIGLLTGTLGLGYAYWQAKQTRRTTIGLYLQELARHNADKVNLILTKEVEWVERLSALPQVREAARQGKRLILDTQELRRWREEQHQYFRSLVIVNQEGRLVGGSASKTSQAHYTHQPWWPVTVHQKRPWVSDLLTDDRGRGYWEVAVPILNEGGGSILGVLKVALGIDELFAPILRTRIGETGHAMLLDEGGHVLVCPVLPGALHSRTDALSGAGLAGAAWAEVQDDTHRARNGIVGVASVTLQAPIAQERTWYILVRQDPKETYGPAVRLMWELTGFWIGAIVLIALFGSGLARRVVRPLEALVERVRLLGESQPTRRLEMARPRPRVEIVEIETLTASFNKMVERLESASQETQRYLQELEKANRELTLSERHYRTLWNHSVDSKLIVDSNGLIREANRRAELKLGRPAEELVGTAAADLFIEQDRARFGKLLQQVLAMAKEGSAEEMQVPSVSGSTLVMELQMVPMEQAGSDQAVLLQLRDITDNKLLEQQLLRSERLASLSKFASMFAHDIRNPLAGIKKTLELLSHRPELQAKPAGRLLADLQFTTDLLLGMINDMLDVYQESYSGLPLAFSTFSVSALLHEVAHLFRSEAEAQGVTIRLAVPDEDVRITGDRRRLQRVGINLVHNALKYSPAGGLITLSMRVQPGETLLLEVRDQGPGVDPEKLPSLFEMFFRQTAGHDLRIGRGLGLHFCRLVVEAHGGRIWAANQASGGAIFSVALPLDGTSRCRSGS